MALIVYWTDFAKAELKNIFDHHNETVSVDIARKIINKIIESTKILSEFPEIGACENLLADRPQNFRYLVSTNYKILYWINIEKNRIEVVDVFDTRQYPKKITRKK
jgi:plasmid stabilization system protein ParE